VISNTLLAAPLPTRRRVMGENADVALACMAALPLGLVLDRSFGFLPALAARCGASDTFWGTLEWHWACMPATCLMMLAAAPAWIGLKVLSRFDGFGGSWQDRRSDKLAALGCHLAMLAGMACALGAGPSVAALVGGPWTSGAAIAAMALGMAGGMAAALLCEALKSGAMSQPE
jgi:hypothetical protein